MLHQRNFRVSRFFTAGIVLLLLLYATIDMDQIALAEAVEQKSSEVIDEIISETVEQESSESIEEIIVYGDKPLHALRREIYKAEENFFAVFSSLNEDDEYDIRCFYETPSFTHIRQHVCRAYFVTNATSAAALVWKSAGVVGPIMPAAVTIQRKKKRLREIMEALVAERPELLQALVKYADARQILESAKKRR